MPHATGRSFLIAHRQCAEKRSKLLPTFATIAAATLALALAVFTVFPFARPPLGFPVELLKPDAAVHDKESLDGRILVSLGSTDANGFPVVCVNSKRTPWEQLENTIRRQHQIQPGLKVYVEATDAVLWAEVAKAIDILEGPTHEMIVLHTIATIPGPG